MGFKIDSFIFSGQIIILTVGLFFLGISISDMSRGGVGDPWSPLLSGFIDGMFFVYGLIFIALAILIPYWEKEQK